MPSMLESVTVTEHEQAGHRVEPGGTTPLDEPDMFKTLRGFLSGAAA